MLMSKCSQVAAAMKEQHAGFRSDAALALFACLLLFTHTVFTVDDLYLDIWTS